MVMNSQITKFDAMQKRIREIVIKEDRPFSFIDLKSFEIDGIQYELKHGTIRNYLSKLTKTGEVEFAYNSGIAFYTLPGKTFPYCVTANRVGSPPSTTSSTSYQRYSYLQMDKESSLRQTGFTQY